MAHNNKKTTCACTAIEALSNKNNNIICIALMAHNNNKIKIL